MKLRHPPYSTIIFLLGIILYQLHFIQCSLSRSAGYSPTNPTAATEYTPGQAPRLSIPSASLLSPDVSHPVLVLVIQLLFE